MCLTRNVKYFTLIKFKTCNVKIWIPTLKKTQRINAFNFSVGDQMGQNKLKDIVLWSDFKMLAGFDWHINNGQCAHVAKAFEPYLVSRTKA